MDPELVSPSVCSALLLEIEAAQGQQTPEACMRHVVSHALQAALGEACEAGVLQRKLQVRSLPCPPPPPHPPGTSPHSPRFLLLLFPYHLFTQTKNKDTFTKENLKNNAEEPRKKIKITHTPLPTHISY